MFLTGGFDGFDVIDSRFWWFWQVVLMVLMFWQQVLMVLTGGFDGFDVLTAGFDSRFWWFWQVVLMVLMFWQQVLMILTGGFDGFDVLTAGFDDFDRWFLFWRLYNKWQQVLMFWQVVFVFEGCIINDRRFCLLKTLLSGNSPSHPPLPIAAYINGSVCSTSIRKRKHELHEHGLFIVP